MEVKDSRLERVDIGDKFPVYVHKTCVRDPVLNETLRSKIKVLPLKVPSLNVRHTKTSQDFQFMSQVLKISVPWRLNRVSQISSTRKVKWGPEVDLYNVYFSLKKKIETGGSWISFQTYHKGSLCEGREYGRSKSKNKHNEERHVSVIEVLTLECFAKKILETKKSGEMWLDYSRRVGRSQGTCSRYKGRVNQLGQSSLDFLTVRQNLRLFIHIDQGVGTLNLPKKR